MSIYCSDHNMCVAEYQTGMSRVGLLSDSAAFKRFYFYPGGVGVGREFSENYGISKWSIGEGGAGARAVLTFARINGEEFGEFVSTVGMRKNPLIFELGQNYPNPFNSTTFIEFNLLSSSQITLTIYDMTGRVVDRVLDEYKSQGHYSMKWTAPGALASGVYFYQLQSARQSKIKKFVYLQ
ncbi:MAG: T9SS type A sorting domain-containing protein [candidate division KSB1 bacterium]|nr:T9SS type A sorting domain-containing protein [candidate division KSB1 bacterium]